MLHVQQLIVNDVQNINENKEVLEKQGREIQEHDKEMNGRKEANRASKIFPVLVLERNDNQSFLQSTLLQLGYWNRWVYSLNQGKF